MENKDNASQYINDLFFRYAIVCGKRFRKKEKEQFLNVFSKELSTMGFENEKFKLVKEKRNLNLYVGDFKKSDVILMSSYDTPMRTITDKNIYPFDPSKQQQAAISTLGVSYVIYTFVMALVFFTFYKLGLFTSTSGISYMYAVYVILFSAGFFYLTFGIPRKTNFVYNSANIISIITMTKELLEQGLSVSIILTDFTAQRNQGIVSAEKYIRDKGLKRYFISSIGIENLFIEKDDLGYKVGCGKKIDNVLVMEKQLSDDSEIVENKFNGQVTEVLDHINKII